MGVFRQFPYSNFHEMNMDEMIKIIKNMLEEWAQYHAEWDAWMTEINDDWSNYQEVMNEAWQNMQDFINNYFVNLDVQEEINNKITDMVHSGEFNQIVEPYIPPTVSEWLAEHITTPETVVIDDSLTIEGAAADAKATGKAIANLKDEIDDLNNEVFDANAYEPNYNYFTNVSENNIRASGETNGDFTGILKYIKIKASASNSVNTTAYLLQKYQSVGVYYYKVYAHFPITIPQCSNEVITLKNGVNYTYNDEIKPNTYVGIALNGVSLYYYIDGTNGLNLGVSSATDGQTFRAVDIEYNYNISLGFIVSNSIIERLSTDVNELMNPSDVMVYNSFIPNFESYDLPAGESLRVGGKYSNIEGYLHSITANIRDVGSAVIYLLTPDVNNLRVIAKFNITTVSGIHEYINGVDFTYNNKLPQIVYVGIKTDCYVYYGTDPDGLVSFANNVDLNVGDLYTMWPANYNIAIGLTIKNSKAELDTIKESITNLMKINRTGVLPTNVYCFPDTSVISCMASVSSLSGKLNLLHSGSRNIANGDGAYIDFGSNKFGFYKAIANATDTLVSIEEDTISYELTTNRLYGIQYRKTITGFELTITDLVTLDTDTITILFTHSNVGGGHGKATHQETNNITVTNFIYMTEQTTTPKTLIIGDSWTDGNTMSGNKAGRWCSLYSDAIDNETFIYAMGGGSVFDGMQWLELLKNIVSPAYVVLQFGVNQGNFNIYKTNISTLIEMVKNNLGATPVLVTIPPTNGASSEIFDDINTWVKNSGEIYIDMCTPLTVDGDGETRNDDLFYPDGTHPNTDGHLAIYNNMKFNVPQLF